MALQREEKFKMKIKFKKLTEREKDIIGLMQGYFGALLLTYWAMFGIGGIILR